MANEGCSGMNDTNTVPQPQTLSRVAEMLLPKGAPYVVINQSIRDFRNKVRIPNSRQNHFRVYGHGDDLLPFNLHPEVKKLFVNRQAGF